MYLDIYIDIGDSWQRKQVKNIDNQARGLNILRAFLYENFKCLMTWANIVCLTNWFEFYVHHGLNLIYIRATDSSHVFSSFRNYKHGFLAIASHR